MRRGVIGLTTNAIVTLIVAAVVLLMLVIFVTGGFTATSKNFLSQTESYTPPPQANELNPIVASVKQPVSAGEQVQMRVTVYNSAGMASDVAISMECPQGVLEGAIEGIPKSIGPQAVSSYTALARVSDQAISGAKVCNIQAVAESGTGRVVAQSDFVLTIK